MLRSFFSNRSPPLFLFGLPVQCSSSREVRRIRDRQRFKLNIQLCDVIRMLISMLFSSTIFERPFQAIQTPFRTFCSGLLRFRRLSDGSRLDGSRSEGSRLDGFRSEGSLSNGPQPTLAQQTVLPTVHPPFSLSTNLEFIISIDTNTRPLYDDLDGALLAFRLAFDHLGRRTGSIRFEWNSEICRENYQDHSPTMKFEVFSKGALLDYSTQLEGQCDDLRSILYTTTRSSALFCSL